MHGAWAAFVTDNDAGWTPFRADQRGTMVFDGTSKVVDDLLAQPGALWP
jgi:carboxylesterase type B